MVANERNALAYSSLGYGGVGPYLGGVGGYVNPVYGVNPYLGTGYSTLKTVASVKKV